MKPFYKSLFLITTISIISACATQRKKDEAKGLSLFFHNLTSKYNGFFNAQVLVEDAVDKLTIQHQDNYNKILDVYPYAAVDNPQSVAPDLDKAIEKVAVAATFHRPSHWTDDAYLLLGKAQYLKHDFKSAEESFQYLVEVYDPASKKRMTSKERKKLAEENKQAKAEARKEVAEQRKKEKEDKDKARKEAAEQAKKDKEEAAKKEKEDLEKRNKEKEEERKNATEQAKKEREAKKETIADRNEARRKANEERRLENERKRKEAQKQGKKKTETEPDTEGGEAVATTPPPTTPKETTKVGSVKTGSNATPVIKEEESIKLSNKKGKPDRYFLKHRPCHQEGIMWLALTHIERQNYTEAELLLESLEKSPKTFKDIRAKTAQAKAHLYLKQANYEAAIPALETAVKLTKKKKQRARLAYILAQIYQLKGNSEKAYAAFDRVLDFSPAYEMEFNARLNMALNSTTALDNTMAMLKKMSKDFKNKEYGDQIYYALAQLALKNNQRAEGVDYLKQALQSGGKNRQQKAEIYYQLAKLEYDAEKYVEAKAYYDSTLQVIEASDVRKPEAERYSANLVEIARNIQIITLQDSLIRIAAMSDKEKRTLATEIKKAKLAQQAAATSIKPLGGGGDLPLAAGEIKSSFFAYFPDNVKKGKKEFEKKWGTDRKLEDNWRRSNKKTGSGDAFNGEIASSEISDKEVAEILKDVPKKKEEIEAAKLKIDDALFQLGTLYHDKLKNDKKAIETLEQDLIRFASTKHELDDWYYLYLAYTSIGNKAKATEYYDKIQSKYSTSNYAVLLKNPDAFKKNDAQNVEVYYAETYSLFKKGDFKQASDKIQNSERLFGLNNPLKAKFALLDAMCKGRLNGRDAYIAALKDVIAKFADTPEEKRAKEILRILEFGNPVTESPAGKASTSTPTSEMGSFKIDNEKFHYILIVLPKDAPVEEAKITLSDYNAKYHRLEDLKISNILLSTESEIPVLVIRRLKDKAAALNYTEGVLKNANDFIKGTTYETFAVTQDNYREILRIKSLDSYREFYRLNYSK